MASSGNFATWNPLANTQAGLAYAGAVYSNGNTRFRGNTGGTATTQLTHGLSSGKWYIEFFVDGSPASGFPMIGIVANGANSGTLQNTSNAPALTITSDIQLVSGEKRVFGSTSGTSYGSGFSDTDICQMAIDIDNGKVWWGKNNTWFASGNPAGGSNAGDTFTAGTEMMIFVGSYEGASYMICNAGQDDTFAGNVTAAGNADGNGFGVFKYSPPTGFLSLCSANLPISDDIDPAQTDDDYNSKQFGVVSYTGNSTTGQTITGLGFQPDCIFAKMNSSTQRWFVTDTNRGITKHLFPDANSDEETDSGMGNTNPIYDAFNSDGFELGTSGSGPNDNSRVYTAMCWKGAGGVNASNAEGSTTCSTQANTKAGFSIITYTGTGSSATLGHGLEKAPETILVKRRSSDQSWAVYHKSLGASQYFTLDSSGGTGSGTGMWNDTAPSATLISIGNDDRVSQSSGTYVAYAWHGVEGYSKFSSYTGTGNADGAFVYTGFRPHMIWTKRQGSGDWIIFTYADNSVNTSYVNGAFNPLDLRQKFTTEASASAKPVDFLSNGFKIRHTDSDTNLSGAEYPYWAWGNPSFKYNQTF